MEDLPTRQGVVPEGQEPGDRRVIRTARTVEAINAAADAGLRPLVRAVTPGKQIHYMVAVMQDPATGRVQLSGDCRRRLGGNVVLDYTLYYPYSFPSPFAAYLVPPDLAAGETVWLDDVIEDVVAVYGNQGYQPRLAACAAVWTGTGFELLFDSCRDAPHWIG
jgi:hypothetical protein